MNTLKPLWEMSDRNKAFFKILAFLIKFFELSYIDLLKLLMTSSRI